MFVSNTLIFTVYEQTFWLTASCSCKVQPVRLTLFFISVLVFSKSNSYWIFCVVIMDSFLYLKHVFCIQILFLTRPLCLAFAFSR